MFQHVVFLMLTGEVLLQSEFHPSPSLRVLKEKLAEAPGDAQTAFNEQVLTGVPVSQFSWRGVTYPVVAEKVLFPI